MTVATLALAKLRGWRKRVCMNYVVSENALSIEPRDLFSANQIIHLRPIVGRRVFQRFVEQNAFVREAYPNFEIPTECLKLHTSSHRASTLAKFDAAMREATAKAKIPATAAKVRAS